MSDEPAVVKKNGCGQLTFLGLLIVIGIIVFGVNIGMGMYGYNCGDDNILKCLDELSNEESEEGAVTAIGNYSHKDNSADVTMIIPLSGGDVSGHVKGDCGGKIKGIYDGKDNGKISGTFAGTCNVFFVNAPVKGTYSATVNKTSKNVPVNFEGGGAGITHNDSMLLTY